MKQTEYIIPYDKFSYVYDQMMTIVDYERWANYLESTLKRNNYKPKTVLDLGCGTGNLTLRLADRGYKMLGIDRAEGMLQLGREKAAEQNLAVGFIRGDMRHFDLSRQFDLIVCTYDSINYMLNTEELEKVFRSVSQHLVPSGLFIFDITTEHNIVQHFHGRTFAGEFDDYSCIWKNNYSYAEQICRTSLTFFIREGELFRRFNELHMQKIFGMSTISKVLAKNNYKLLGAYDMYTFKRPHRYSDRINITIKKLN